MKKTTGIFAALLTFILASCADPLYYNIRKEVPLKSGTVKGAVNSIVRYTFEGEEYIVAQTGASVFYKKPMVERTGDSSVWTKRGNSVFGEIAFEYLDSKFNENGRYITKIASDSTSLYLLATKVGIDDDESEVVIDSYYLYKTSSLTGTDWSLIHSWKNDGTCTLICTNSIAQSGRTAFLKKNGKLYQLSDSVTAETLLASEYATGISSEAYSCVYFNGGIKFFDSPASVTNETAENPATMYFFVKDKDEIFYFDGTEEKKVYGASNNVSCIAVTKDSLIFGQGNPKGIEAGGGGLHRIALKEDGTPEGATSAFRTNADAAMTTSYQILALMAADPSKTELDNCIYASSNFKTSGVSLNVSFENIGLWAYYPSRGNWNRE